MTKHPIMWTTRPDNQGRPVLEARLSDEERMVALKFAARRAQRIRAQREAADTTPKVDPFAFLLEE